MYHKYICISTIFSVHPYNKAMDKYVPFHFSKVWLLSLNFTHPRPGLWFRVLITLFRPWIFTKEGSSKYTKKTLFIHGAGRPFNYQNMGSLLGVNLCQILYACVRFCEHERLWWGYERLNPSNSRILNSRPISIVSPTQFQKDHNPSHRFVAISVLEGWLVFVP